VAAVKVLEGPLEAVSRVARPFPAWLLNGCETGLCLFAAAFLGHNDAIHFARAGIQTTCVDKDAARIEKMIDLYPRDWEFLTTDAWGSLTTRVPTAMALGRGQRRHMERRR
jgi:hypothetical protein